MFCKCENIFDNVFWKNRQEIIQMTNYSYKKFLAFICLLNMYISKMPKIREILMSDKNVS